MLTWILIGLGVAITLVLVLAATRPAAYRIEHKLEISGRAFEVLSDVKTFTGILVLFGDPWDKPKLTKNFAGDSVEWSGDGAGKISITERVAGSKVVIRLEFSEPMKSIADHTITINGSSVVWVMTGNHNFIGRVAGLFMNMDKALGGDIEKSLARLKSVAEKPA